MKTTSSLAVTRRSLLRAQALFGILLTVSAVAPRTAHAARSPLIHGRAAWQARSPRGTVRLSSGRPRRLIIHHTATGNTSDGSLARAYSLARAIQSHHMDTFGWIDTGQHFTVSRGAFILEGRDGSLDSLDSAQGMVIGSHCYGQNTVSIGIETEGTYTHVAPPEEQYEALVGLCTRLCRQYGLPASEIYGHRDFNATLCPGDALYASLPQLRYDVDERLIDPELSETRHVALADVSEETWEGLVPFMPPLEFVRR
ncbi:peptidoglycan recognition protein family protein [Streptomyces erythrochromogenes]|uniref:peptidoglycan recognition protein family protein n=1 Tax=Streptomyces erythrochromogenes TaxID=285574 RepID=UPI0037F1ACA3